MITYQKAISLFFEALRNNNIKVSESYISGAYIMLCRMIQADNNISSKLVEPITSYFMNCEAVYKYELKNN